jgi:cell division protein FtsQ
MHILAVLLIAVAGYFFIQSSLFSISLIKVLGTQSVSGEEIVGISGLEKGENIFKINTDSAKEKILTHALVEEVEINKKLPATLEITVRERIPAAFIPAEEGLFQIDLKGNILRKQAVIGSQLLPIITGAELPSGTGVGKRLESDQLQMGLQMIAQMDEQAKEIVAELDVSNPQKLRAYTVQGTEVRLGDAKDFKEKFNKFLQVIKEEEKRGTLDKMEYIDVSFSGRPVVFYRK